MSFSALIENADRAVQTHLGATTVIYTPAAGDPVEVLGLFDENSTLVPKGHAAAELTGPVVWLRRDDLPSDPDTDDPTLTINGVVYDVRERQGDGPAGRSIRLLLHRSPSS